MWPLIISSNSLFKAEAASELDLVAQALCSQVLIISKDGTAHSSPENLLQCLISGGIHIFPPPRLDLIEICHAPVSFWCEPLRGA